MNFPTVANDWTNLGFMPAPKKPTTFDAHLGSVINGLAKPHGGRPRLAELLVTSKKTIDRRMAGDIPLLVKELEVIAAHVNASAESMVDQALKNYGDGDRAVGLAKLQAEINPPTNVGDIDEDDFDVTPSGPKADYALTANKRPKKVDTPAAE